MLEDFEAQVDFGRELTADEITRFEHDSTEKFLGGNKKGYVELRKAEEQSGKYKILIRI